MTVITERHDVAPGVVGLVTVAPCITVSIDGFGGRDTETFHKAYDTLRPIAWTLHHRLRSDERYADHHLAPIEALWWTDAGVTCWRLFISEHGDVPVDVVVAVVRDLPAVRNLPDAGMLDVRVLHEDVAVQTLHLGGLDHVDSAVALLEEQAQLRGLVTTGPRHEIYLSHVRRCDPDHMRTLIRVPVRPAEG